MLSAAGKSRRRRLLRCAPPVAGWWSADRSCRARPPRARRQRRPPRARCQTPSLVEGRNRGGWKGERRPNRAGQPFELYDLQLLSVVVVRGDGERATQRCSPRELRCNEPCYQGGLPASAVGGSCERSKAGKSFAEGGTEWPAAGAAEAAALAAEVALLPSRRTKKASRPAQGKARPMATVQNGPGQSAAHGHGARRWRGLCYPAPRCPAPRRLAPRF